MGEGEFSKEKVGLLMEMSGAARGKLSLRRFTGEPVSRGGRVSRVRSERGTQSISVVGSITRT